MDISAALDAFRHWPLSDQLEFLQRAWDQVAESGWQPELTDPQRAELDRRIAAYQGNPSDVLTWDQVEAHLRRPR
jgi:putative addiction module component (TIGR02574 family)